MDSSRRTIINLGYSAHSRHETSPSQILVNQIHVEPVHLV